MKNTNYSKWYDTCILNWWKLSVMFTFSSINKYKKVLDLLKKYNITNCIYSTYELSVYVTVI